MEEIQQTDLIHKVCKELQLTRVLDGLPGFLPEDSHNLNASEGPLPGISQI